MAYLLITSGPGATATTTGTISGGALGGVQAGDKVLVFAFRDGSTTAPGLGSNYIDFGSSGGANLCSMRCGVFTATGTSIASTTWSSATSIVYVVYRNAVFGQLTRFTGSSTSFNYGAVTFVKNDSTSGAVAFVGTTNGGNAAGAPNVEGPPTGMTFIAQSKDTTDAAAAHYTTGNISSWGGATVSTGVSATGWITAIIEIMDGDYTLGAGLPAANLATNSGDQILGVLITGASLRKNLGKFTLLTRSTGGTITMKQALYTVITNATDDCTGNFIVEALSTQSISTTDQLTTFQFPIQSINPNTNYWLTMWTNGAFETHYNSVTPVSSFYKILAFSTGTWPSSIAADIGSTFQSQTGLVIWVNNPNGRQLNINKAVGRAANW